MIASFLLLKERALLPLRYEKIGYLPAGGKEKRKAYEVRG